VSYSEETFFSFGDYKRNTQRLLLRSRSQHHSKSIVNGFRLEVFFWVCGSGKHMLKATPFKPTLGSTQPYVQQTKGALSMRVNLNLN
jgi:hypothetical protein